MSKITILLIIIAILFSGVGGFILGAQNSQIAPVINTVNNTTDESSYVNDEPQYNYSKYKSNTTSKKITQSTVPTSNSKTDTNTDTKPVNKTN